VTVWQRHTDPPDIETVAHPLPANLGHLDGTRIVQISDLHVGKYFRADTWALNIQRIHKLQPDLVVITGDAMDWSRRYEDDYLEPMRRLEARHGVLAILGNHDFYFGPNRLARMYAETNVTLLRAQSWSTDALRGLQIWGVDDPMTNLSRPSSYPQLESWRSAMDPKAYHLLLAHRPDAFRQAARAGFDLQLSGHTHGGQIRWDTRWGEVGWKFLLKPWDRGEFTARDSQRGSRLYVNRGLGYTAVPYRRDCSSEITVHELRSVTTAPSVRS
jgi:predicted MPP superfamily phosphohydrolase